MVNAVSSSRAPDAAPVSSVTDAIWAVLAVLGFTGFAGLAWLLASHVTFALDPQLLAIAKGWNAWAPVWNALSFAAYLPLAALAVGFMVWLWRNHRRHEAVLVLVLLIAVTAGSEAVKQLVARPRPPDSAEVVPGVVYSFPSGHVLEGLVILGVIALTAWRSTATLWLRIAVVLIATALVILLAVARLSLNAHFPTDVLGGFLAGLGCLSAYAWLTRPKEIVDRAAEPAAV